jgi:hypothetical protein
VLDGVVVAVGLRSEPAAPPAQGVEPLPILPKRSVRLRRLKELVVLKQVEVDSQPLRVEAVRYPCPRRGVPCRLLWRTVRLPERKLVPFFVRERDELRYELHEQALLLP